MEIHEEAIAQMKDRVRAGTRWAAYENQALDSANAGHIQFLHVGDGCTYAEPPQQYPMDNAWGMGWRYRFIGWANLDTGKVERVHG